MKNKNQDYDKGNMYKITQRDLENPNRFIGEGLGAPEFRVKTEKEAAEEMKNYQQIESRNGKKNGFWNKVNGFLSKALDYMGNACISECGIINPYGLYISPIISERIKAEQKVHRWTGKNRK